MWCRRLQHACTHKLCALTCEALSADATANHHHRPPHNLTIVLLTTSAILFTARFATRLTPSCSSTPQKLFGSLPSSPAAFDAPPPPPHAAKIEEAMAIQRKEDEEEKRGAVVSEQMLAREILVLPPRSLPTSPSHTHKAANVSTLCTRNAVLCTCSRANLHAQC